MDFSPSLSSLVPENRSKKRDGSKEDGALALVVLILCVSVFASCSRKAPFERDDREPGFHDEVKEAIQTKAGRNAIAELGANAIPPLAEVLREDKSCFFEVISLFEKLGPEVIPDLIDLMGDGNDEVVLAAASALAEFGRLSLDQLIRTSKTGNPQTRRWAIWAMNWEEDPDWREQVKKVLLDGMRDPDVGVTSVSTVKAATMFESDPDVLREMENGLDSPDPFRREWSVYGIHEMHVYREGDIDGLLHLLEDSEESVRFWSAMIILEVDPGHDGSQAILLSALENGPEECRGIAARALGEAAVAEDDIIRALLAVARVEDEDLAEDARAALSSIVKSNLDVFHFLEEVMTSSVDGAGFQSALVVLEVLPGHHGAQDVAANRLENGSEKEKVLAARALGDGVGISDRAYDALVVARMDRSERVREEAESAMEKLGLD